MPETVRSSPPRLGQAVKRAADAVLAAAGLLALSPVIVAVAAVVRVRLGSPVLFRQTRPGRGERPFVMYKFRTMRDATDAAGRPLPDTERLTRLGRFLRTTSLDELPELFNVLRGDMSLVGPRPLLAEYLPFYSERERKRHLVRPGITGWAQVHGRNALSWDERLSLDSWYVENWTLRLDAAVLLRTLGAVLRRDGVQVDPRAVMQDLDVERRRASGQAP